MIKLSQWAKNQNLSYNTAYSLFKTGKLPCKSIQLDTGTILVEDSKKTMCKMADKKSKRQFTVSIDLDLVSCGLCDDALTELQQDLERLAEKVARMIGFDMTDLANGKNAYVLEGK